MSKMMSGFILLCALFVSLNATSETLSKQSANMGSYETVYTPVAVDIDCPVPPGVYEDKSLFKGMDVKLFYRYGDIITVSKDMLADFWRAFKRDNPNQQVLISV